MLILSVLAVTVFVFSFYRAGSNELEPQIKYGDLILVNKIERDFFMDDLVVAFAGNEKKTGKILATSGDVLTIDEQGCIYVNGTYTGTEVKTAKKIKKHLRIKTGEIYLYIGNNTNGSGLVVIPEEKVVGKINALIRRRF